MTWKIAGGWCQGLSVVGVIGLTSLTSLTSLTLVACGGEAALSETGAAASVGPGTESDTATDTATAGDAETDTDTGSETETGDEPAPVAGCPQALEVAITEAALVGHLEALADLGGLHGENRAAATPGYEASADYAEDLLLAAGYTVERHSFVFHDFKLTTPPELEVLAPEPANLVHGGDFEVARFSGAGEVSGPVVAVDLALGDGGASTSGCEGADFNGFPAGAIALLQRGGCTFATKESLAANAGASAVVLFNQGDSPGRMGVFAAHLSPGATIPVLTTSYNRGVAFAAAIDDGLELRLSVTGGVVEQLSDNILAEAPGAVDGPVIAVGAHLDSVLAGPGINDNGSGSAAVLELAVQLSRCELRYPVRLALWGAEELGLLGSAAYVQDLPAAEREGLALYLNLDMIASPNSARFLYDGDGSTFGAAGPVGSGALEADLAAYYAERGFQTLETPFDGRSDYGPFVAVGVPSGGIFTGAEGIKSADQAMTFGGDAGEAYDACYHRLCDDRDNYDAGELTLNTRAAADRVEAYATGRLALPAESAAVRGSPSIAAVAGPMDSGHDGHHHCGGPPKR